MGFRGRKLNRAVSCLNVRLYVLKLHRLVACLDFVKTEMKLTFEKFGDLNFYICHYIVANVSSPSTS